MAEQTSPDYIAATRKQMEDMEQASIELLGPCPSDLTESVIEIRLKDGFISRTILIRPVTKTSSSKLGNGTALEKHPLIVFIHGGSFTYCSPNMVLSPARAFASHFNAVVACISYKMAPEYPFPAPVQSAWEVVAWLSQPKNLNSILANEGMEYDPNLGFVLAGCSAGGNAAAVIASIDSTVKAGHQEELVKNLPKVGSEITGLFISIPYLMGPDIIPDKYLSMFRSREEYSNAPFINAKTLESIAILYNQDPRSPWFSPLNLDFVKMRQYHPGKVYVHAGELDIIRDDAIIYERMLRDAGIAETKIDVLQGYDHACWCNLLLDQAHTQEMKEITMDGMAWLLNREWDRTTPLSH